MNLDKISVFIDGSKARLSVVYFFLMQSIVMDDGIHFIRSLDLIPRPQRPGGILHDSREGRSI